MSKKLCLKMKGINQMLLDERVRELKLGQIMIQSWKERMIGMRIHDQMDM